MAQQPQDAVARDLAELVLAGEVDRDGLEDAKNRLCAEHGASRVPKHSDVLDAVPEHRREEAESVLRTTPVRTASGVTPVAVMTSPAPCPHGKCTFCPGGPDSDYGSPMSYTGEEPAAMRGEHNDHDPFDQVTQRLRDLRETGHVVDKVELILMGGTMSARSHDYQAWFVKRCLQAMNRFDPDASPDEAPGRHPGRPEAGDPEHAADGGTAAADAVADDTVSPEILAADWTPWAAVESRNETAGVRNIGTTFETKPDWCDPEQIDRMLRLGGTKVEVGVQTLDDDTLRRTHRGHDLDDVRAANRRLHDAGFKVGFHLMPGMPGRTPEDDVADLHAIFDDPAYRPDFLKIYPTLVVRGTGLYDRWRRGSFTPLDNAEAADVVARGKARIPPYCRLSRVQRDIPATEVVAGVWRSNLRQLARDRLDELGGRCDCIRCREVGHRDGAPDDLALDVVAYDCAGGEERFIQLHDPSKDLLVGFCRLRYPGEVVRDELEDAAIVRELHVYGDEAAVSDRSDAASDETHQHRGHGERLFRRAERLASEAGYGRLAVISGIGVREYYRGLGCERDGPYMVEAL
jgi:elongator complex protein 3